MAKRHPNRSISVETGLTGKSGGVNCGIVQRCCLVVGGFGRGDKSRYKKRVHDLMVYDDAGLLGCWDG